MHRQSHFDTQLGPLPPTATAHCCCTHTCEYTYVHARMCVAGPMPVQSTSTLSSQCHQSAVGTIHTTNVGQLEPVKQHKIACTIQPVTGGRARTAKGHASLYYINVSISKAAGVCYLYSSYELADSAYIMHNKDVKYIHTYLLWGLDVLTLQFFHMFKVIHNTTHHIKWDT